MWSAQYVKQFLDSCHNAAVVDKLTKDKTEIQEKRKSIWLNIRDNTPPRMTRISGLKS